MPHDHELNPDFTFLWHIQRACRQMQSHLEGISYEDFQSSSLIQNAVYWNINVIGEAVGNLSDDFKQTHQEIPFQEARAARNRIVHGYDSIKNDIIWKIATLHIPQILDQITALIPDPPTD